VKKDERCIVVAIILLISVLMATSGCFSNESFNPRISSMDVNGLEIEYDEFILINYTYAKSELEKIGYRVKSHIDPDFHRDDLDYALYVYSSPDDKTLSEWTFLISAWTREDNTTSGKFGIVYFPLGEYALDEEKAKKLVEEVGNEVAEICNLSLDWDKAHWTVHWSDDTTR